MLIKCPECELQVSDKAMNCPHCGYPITSSTPVRKTSKKKTLETAQWFWTDLGIE